jgi:hypothetical protein
MGWSHFAYGFEFNKKFDSEIAKIGLRCLKETAEANFFLYSSPLIFTFYSNDKYVMITYVFVFALVSL